MKLIITASGGGHFSPALSVIESLPNNIEVVFIGRKYALEGEEAISLEYKTARELHIPFKVITTGRLQRKLTKHTFPSLLRVPYGFVESLRILKDARPDAVLSFGGYIALPVCMAAFFLKIPVVVHEQTLEAGLSNRVTALFARKICISWESSSPFFPKKRTVLTGNPLRKSFFLPKTSVVAKDDLPLLYITGGSLGSHAINALVEGYIERLLQTFIVYHQTGDSKEFRDYDRLERLRGHLREDVQQRYILTKFVDSTIVPSILSEADIVVARAGMSTMTELLYMGKPSLLIPLAYSQNNEQVKNAMFFKDVGLGEVAFQDILTEHSLYNEIIRLFEKREYYAKANERARALIKIDAAECIIHEVLPLVKNKK